MSIQSYENTRSAGLAIIFLFGPIVGSFGLLLRMDELYQLGILITVAISIVLGIIMLLSIQTKSLQKFK